MIVIAYSKFHVILRKFAMIAISICLVSLKAKIKRQTIIPVMANVRLILLEFVTTMLYGSIKVLADVTRGT